MEHAVLQKKLGLLRCTLMPVEVTLGVVKVWSGFCRGCQGISGVKRWVTVGPYRIGAGRVRGDQVQSINGMRFQAAAPSHDPSADVLSNVAVFEPLHGWDVEICGYICWYMLYIHMYIYIYIYIYIIEQSYWLVVEPPIWTIWKSLGITIPEGRITHVLNHQPDELSCSPDKSPRSE